MSYLRKIQRPTKVSGVHSDLPNLLEQAKALQGEILEHYHLADDMAALVVQLIRLMERLSGIEIDEADLASQYEVLLASKSPSKASERRSINGPST